MTLLCRIGWHRDWVVENRTGQRVPMKDGEILRSLEHKMCSCGQVVETESYERYTRRSYKLGEDNANIRETGDDLPGRAPRGDTLGGTTPEV